ncbi:hypothetical protein CPB97_009438 [Podila verticillata]|nr:hypothetical protein CPB97_009438 [Podila verticillata]
MDIEDLGHLAAKPKVTNYNPCTVRNLRPGSIKEWCTCGLTKKGPWCDGKSHKGTSFKPLRWKVPDGKNAQTMYSICDCRYTTRPPFCDGIHYDLPLRYLKKIKECPKAPHDPTVTKLCETCGWAGPRESWPELPPSSSDSDSDDSLLSSDEDEKMESEEAKKKREAANSPRVQLQIQNDESTTMEVDDACVTSTTPATNTMPIGCTGSCQTGLASQEELSKMADEINRVHLS